VSQFGTLGNFQHFESDLGDYGDAATENTIVVCGATIYASEKGVFVTGGSLGDYYEAGGGARGPLGFPLSQGVELSILGRSVEERYVQEFEGGTVYWGESAGMACVLPPIEEVHGSDLRAHGLPVGEQQIAQPSRQGTTGVFQRFEGHAGSPYAANLSIYSSASHGVWPVSGLILEYFMRSGGTSGPFGFPAGPVHSFESAPFPFQEEQRFESGAILRHFAGRPEIFGVVGKIYELWVTCRARLGRPESDERMLGGGPDLVQFFEHGVISVVDGTAEFWLRPVD
jgi:uncharacterized protein with LGFP repeats